MKTPEPFHINNNIRLLKIATTPRKHETDFYEKAFKTVHKKAFQKPIVKPKNN